MSISCPPEIFELMTNTVVWESFQGFDGHAEPVYLPAVELTCWQESHGLTGGGLEVFRYADGTQVEPQWDLFFNGDDPLARQIQLYDRFTTDGVASGVYFGTQGNLGLQAVRVNTLQGPPFDNKNPWLIQVTL